MNREYNGRGIVFVGRAIDNLLGSKNISFFIGNYVLEDAGKAKVDEGMSKGISESD